MLLSLIILCCEFVKQKLLQFCDPTNSSKNSYVLFSEIQYFKFGLVLLKISLYEETFSVLKLRKSNDTNELQ